MKPDSLPDAPSPRPWPGGDFQEAVRRRAEEIYIRNGKVPGRDLENWAQAEREILEAERPSRRKAVIIRVNGEQYIGEYLPDSCDGYSPGEISPGATVPIRLHGDKMFVQRPNGKELETTIVRKIG